MLIDVDESCCLFYIKRKKTNETIRILINFKKEALMTAWDEIFLVLWVTIKEGQL